uniref:Uncharacterized protein n=1 Tax=Lepeophtheirus salmonis TaxID=72036 RepID=A0A0K2VBX8_LEPSM
MWLEIKVRRLTSAFSLAELSDVTNVLLY